MIIKKIIKLLTIFRSFKLTKALKYGVGASTEHLKILQIIAGSSTIVLVAIYTQNYKYIIVGNVSSPEDAAGAVATVTDADTISLVASKAVHGDYVHVWSDGTNWYLDGQCKVQDGITTTQAS